MTDKRKKLQDFKEGPKKPLFDVGEWGIFDDWAGGELRTVAEQLESMVDGFRRNAQEKMRGLIAEALRLTIEDAEVFARFHGPNISFEIWFPFNEDPDQNGEDLHYVIPLKLQEHLDFAIHNAEAEELPELIGVLRAELAHAEDMLKVLKEEE